MNPNFVRKIGYLLTVVFVATLPIENVALWPVIGSPARAVGALATVAWLVSISISGQIRKPSVFHLIAGLFCLWSMASVLWSRFPNQTLARTETYIQLFILMYIIWDLCVDRRQIELVLMAYISGCYVAITLIIRNFLQGVTYGRWDPRFSVASVDPNDLGVMLAMGVPIAVWLVNNTSTQTWFRLALYAYIPFGTFAVLLTASRTAFVSLVVAYLYLMVSLSRLRIVTRLLIVVMVVVAVAFVPRFVPEGSFARIGEIGESVGSGDFTGRVDVWQEGLEVFMSHPAIGVGAGTFVESIDLRRAPHNVFIGLSAELGVIGIMLFAFMLLAVIVAALFNAPTMRLLWLTLLVMWLVGATTLNWEYQKHTWVLFTLVISSANLIQYSRTADTVGKSSNTFFPIGQPTSG